MQNKTYIILVFIRPIYDNNFTFLVKKKKKSHQTLKSDINYWKNHRKHNVWSDKNRI